MRPNRRRPGAGRGPGRQVERYLLAKCALKGFLLLSEFLDSPFRGVWSNMAANTSTQAAAPAVRDESNPDTEYVAELLGLYRGKGGGLDKARVAAWAEDRGALEDGRPARPAASCLLRPQVGDRVLCWTDDSGAWVLAVLEREREDAPAVLSAPNQLNIQAPTVALQGRVVQVAARDFLSSVDNRHAVENTRTQHARLRVCEVGTDIRRATVAEDRISGTMLQRFGTWLSTTAHEARLKARTFLFE